MPRDPLEECRFEADVFGLEDKAADEFPWNLPFWPEALESEGPGLTANVFELSSANLDTHWPDGDYLDLGFDLSDGTKAEATVFIISPEDSHIVDHLCNLEEAEEWSNKVKGLENQCDDYEKVLLPSIKTPGKDVISDHHPVMLTDLPDKIDVTFSDVYVSPVVIETIQSLTMLTLLSPEAFTYGVLAKSKGSGVLLHGPPGTGKTLLAQAVAKESGAAFLEVSGADMFNKYHGESEKMIRATFSLAKKIKPCVLFMDEADGLFKSRTSGDEGWYRTINNQFLREWDGSSGGSVAGVFIIMATNRISDLDAAVVRRFQQRILIDVPTVEAREAILRIHLRGELLGPDVDLAAIAKLAPNYTGSDLKNVCVAAALAHVYEDVFGINGEKKYKKGISARRTRKRANISELVERRVLRARHFSKALQDVSSSSETSEPALAKMKKFGNLYKANAKGKYKS
jgi:SpoVK/Ycf46/Vps4 family AAA+-type ATPase